MEQPPSQQEGVGGGLFKGTRQFTWPVPAMLIDVLEEHNFTPVHLLPFISSTWEPFPATAILVYQYQVLGYIANLYKLNQF